MPSLGQGLQRLRVLGPGTWGGPATKPPAVDLSITAPPAGARLGVAIRPEVSQDLLEHLGLDGAIAVESVQEGTLAEALGIQPFDLVSRIGDKPIRSATDVQAALSGIEEGQDVAVTVWRKGKECALTAKKHAAKSQESKGSEAAPDAAPSPLQKRSEGR
jgi:C-terminal processing protease CtpA/Prc